MQIGIKLNWSVVYLLQSHMKVDHPPNGSWIVKLFLCAYKILMWSHKFNGFFCAVSTAALTIQRINKRPWRNYASWYDVIFYCWLDNARAVRDWITQYSFILSFYLSLFISLSLCYGCPTISQTTRRHTLPPLSLRFHQQCLDKRASEAE